MARTITSISIFLASPADVAHERDVVGRVIQQWNDRHGRDRAVHYELLRFESSVSSGFGEDGQDVINSQIGDEYDVLIALFWKRIGSPTPRGRSGTVEEYERALERFRGGENVELAFFFKDAPIDFRKDDLDQVARIKEFEKEVQTAGALSKMFGDDEALTFELNLLLDRLAREQSSQASRGLVLRTESGAATSATEVVGQESDSSESDELGVWDFSENLLGHATKATGFLSEMTGKLNLLTEVVSKTTSDMQEITNVRAIDASEGKAFMRGVTSSMNDFGAFLEAEFPQYAENTSLMMEDIRGLIDVSYDFISGELDEEARGNLLEFRATISGMEEVMRSSLASFSSYLRTLTEMPRMTVALNKAKKRLLVNIKVLLDKMEADVALVGQAIGEMDKLIAAVEH